jgi:AraC-like DNA-binding protein
MDPLSDLLSLLRPRRFMFRGLDIGGRWSLRFPVTDGIKCYAVVSGECWLTVDGVDHAVRLTAGDCILLTRRQTPYLASDTTLSPTDVLPFFRAVPEGGIATINGGGQFSGLGGFFDFAGKHAELLLALLPPLLQIRKEADRARLRLSMEMMMQELSEPQPVGASLLAQQLGHMMLVLAIRLHLAEGAAGVGWLAALGDKQMAAAINAMHRDPAHRWTLQSLAAHACMSRSTFAQRFNETVGEPPMEYLVRWRMVLAGDKLVHSNDSLTTIANSLGYESDSAFSAAFRRIMGCSPRQYSLTQHPENAPADTSDEGEADTAPL